MQNPLVEIVPDAIKEYPIIETDWRIKRWLKIDQQLLLTWYEELLNNYSDWKWEYGKHNYMWKYDPQEKIGSYFQSDTAWIMLTWGDDTQGPVPWLRTITKDEYNAQMPNHELAPRECFKGYALDVISNFPVLTSDVQVALHTPKTRLPEHQDSPEKFRFHIPILTNPDAKFVIDGKTLHLPADGWVYIVNTTYPHYTDNQGDTTRVHIYGAIDTEQTLKLDLINCETIA
jgi:hypothetical protein